MARGRQWSLSGYFNAMSRNRWMNWAWSSLAAAGINLTLFLLMPHLMDPAPSRSSIETLVPQINVIRINRPETPIKQKPIKPPEPPEPKPTEKPKAPKPIKTRLTLPFEINPKLPGGPTTLDLPPLKSARLVTNGLPDAFSVGQLDAPLTTLVRIPPVYPMRARQRGIAGWVTVSFVVDETGNVDQITIIEARPPGIFEHSVERCVGGWRFKPGTVEGMPVKALVQTTIRFELEE